MKRYGWTALKVGSRRVDGVELSPPVDGGEGPYSALVPAFPVSVTVQLVATNLEAAWEECDTTLPLPSWWLAVMSAAADQLSALPEWAQQLAKGSEG